MEKKVVETGGGACRGQKWGCNNRKGRVLKGGAGRRRRPAK